VSFSDNGSTAVESALRLALQYFSQNGEAQRTRLLCLEGAFHGDTLGAAEVSGVEEFNQPGRSSREICRLPSPARGLERALLALEAELETAGSRTAALVLEPVVQAAAGMRIYSPEYLRVARRLTDKAGVLLIADEVFTGFGRTGPMWGVDHAQVSPDILCVAKGLSGGLLPFAAVLTTEQIFLGFTGDPRRAFYYGHTYSGNPLGAAVALETLRVYEEEQVLAQAQRSADLLQQAQSRLSELSHVREVRSIGMVLALDLEGAQGYLERGGWGVYHEALLRGAYLRPLGNVVYVTPALNIHPRQLERLLEVMFESVRAAGNISVGSE
jgi:adenosylmethionine-8-amino-7-oxononanoate aminotransferase